MPMPHEDMKRLIQRRLKGAEGTQRIRVLDQCLAMLPGYRQGPYADLRKWILQQKNVAKTRAKTRHADGLFVPREGDARIVLLGPPNAGKSSLLKALSASQVAVGDYPFTTLRPIAANVKINDALIQLVEIPGLIQGAREDRGSGRMYLAAAQDAHGFLLILPLEEASLGGFFAVFQEAREVVGERPFLVVATKTDLPEAQAVLALAVSRMPQMHVVTVSSTTGEGLDTLRQRLWEMTGLMRVYSKKTVPGARDDRPFIVPAGTTVGLMAAHIHNELAMELDRAAVWGPSAKFPGQVVGSRHILQDGDRVEMLKRK